MNPLRPTVSDFLFSAPSGERQPSLIEELAKLVPARHPEEHGSAIRHGAKALLAFTHLRLGKFTLPDLGEQPNDAHDGARSVGHRAARDADPDLRSIVAAEAKIK